jgi:hypothetical protein
VPLDTDDGKRPTFGVVVSLLDLGDGTCRLILDDARSAEPRRETSWQFSSFCTNKRVDSRQLDAMSLPEAEYQDLGAVVLARLVALNGRVKCMGSVVLLASNNRWRGP